MSHSLLLLPGNDPRQREWIQSVATELSSLFTRWEAVSYLHWSNPKGAGIDLVAELARIPSYPIAGEKPVIFAKSVGVVLALMASGQGLLAPCAAIFVGFPLNQCRQNSFPVEQSLRAFPGPILLIQNDNDPYCSGQELGAFVKGAETGQCHTVILSGATHHYPDLVAIRTAAEAFLVNVVQ